MICEAASRLTRRFFMCHAFRCASGESFCYAQASRYGRNHGGSRSVVRRRGGEPCFGKKDCAYPLHCYQFQRIEGLWAVRTRTRTSFCSSHESLANLPDRPGINFSGTPLVWRLCLIVDCIDRRHRTMCTWALTTANFDRLA